MSQKPWEKKPSEFLTAGERIRNSSLASKRWKAANPDKVRAYGRKSSAVQRMKNADVCKQRVRDWHAKNRERVSEQKRAYYEANKERIKERSRLNYLKSQAHKRKQRCLNCESILKEANTLYCTWCINTYKLCPTKTQLSNA